MNGVVSSCKIAVWCKKSDARAMGNMVRLCLLLDRHSIPAAGAMQPSCRSNASQLQEFYSLESYRRVADELQLMLREPFLKEWLHPLKYTY